MLNQILERLELNPGKLFLIDGLGASLSAFLLGIVLVKLEHIFGIPPSALYFLAAIPIFFAIYDFYCYQKENQQLSPYLKGIAILNLVYCWVSIGFALYHRQDIKFWGWYYIISEVAIIVMLVIIELKLANRLSALEIKR